MQQTVAVVRDCVAQALLPVLKASFLGKQAPAGVPVPHVPGQLYCNLSRRCTAQMTQASGWIGVNDKGFTGEGLAWFVTQTWDATLNRNLTPASIW